MLDEAYREITVRDGDQCVSVPMAQAAVRAFSVNAAKGRHPSQRLFAEMWSATKRQNKALADVWQHAAIEYKAEWGQELEHREVLGITNLPDPLPHSDQVPMSKEERAQLVL